MWSTSNREWNECKLQLVRCVGNTPESSGAEPYNISKLDRLPFFKWCFKRGDYPCHGSVGMFSWAVCWSPSVSLLLPLKMVQPAPGCEVARQEECVCTGNSSFSSRVAWYPLGSGFSPRVWARSVYFALICANSWQATAAAPDLCWQDRPRSWQLTCPCFMKVEAGGNRVSLVPAVLQHLTPEAGLVLRKASDPAAGSDEERRAEEAA